MPKATPVRSGSKFDSFVAAIGRSSNLQGFKGKEKAALAALSRSAEYKEMAIADAVKGFESYGGPASGSAWYVFNGLGEGSRALPSLDDLVTKAGSLDGFMIGPQAEDVAKRLVDAMEDLKLLINYGKVVTALITYIKMFKNNLENMHAKASDEDKATARGALDMLGIEYDEAKSQVDWTKQPR